jgi:hypothetical protein
VNGDDGIVSQPVKCSTLPVLGVGMAYLVLPAVMLLAHLSSIYTQAGICGLQTSHRFVLYQRFDFPWILMPNFVSCVTRVHIDQIQHLNLVLDAKRMYGI